MTMKRPILASVVAGLALALSLSACGSGADNPDPGSNTGSNTGGGGQSRPVSFTAPTAAQLADGVRLGDQTDQSLTQVAAKGRTVVAIGTESSANVTLPLVATSADGGKTWARAEVPLDPQSTSQPDLVSVAAGPQGFAAVGSRASKPILMTSTDGVTWVESVLPGRQFTGLDSVTDVRHFNGTWYLLGSNSQRSGDASSRIILWSSKDLTAWTRSDLSRTAPPVEGTPTGFDVIEYEGRIYIVGDIFNDTSAYPNRIAIWESGNGGKRFVQTQHNDGLGSEYRAYATDWLVAKGELLLAGRGPGPGEGWDGFIIGRSGGQWVVYSNPAFSTPQEDRPTTLLYDGKNLIMAGDSVGSSADALVGVGSGLINMVAVKHPTFRGAGPQGISAGVVVGRETILVGRDGRSGSTEPAVWRLRGKRVTPVKLPSELTDGQPAASVRKVVKWGEQYLAIGGAADSPVIWTSPDFEQWTPVGLSGRTNSITTAAAQDVAIVDGTAVVLGSVFESVGTQAAVWRGSNGHWNHSIAPVDVRTSEGFNSIVPTALASNGGRLAASANTAIDAWREIQPISSSTDGAFWNTGVGHGSLELTDGEEYFHRTPYRDFRAPSLGSLVANSVSALGKRFVMGGARTEPGQGARPVIWRSNQQGLVWARSQRLPMPDSAYGAEIQQILSRGATVVATGSVLASEAQEDEPGWVSWVSTDAGKTWQVGTPPTAAAASVAAVVGIPGGFLALGEAGEPGRTDAAAWTSPDGLTWTPVELETGRASGAGEQAYSSAIVEGDQLRLIGKDIGPQGGGYYSATVAVPTL